MRVVPVNCVKENSSLAKHIYDADGRILLKKGTCLTRGLIKRILDIGIHTIYINDEYSNNEIEDIIKPEVRLRAVKGIKDTFESFSKYSKQKNMNTSSVKEKQFLKERDKHIEVLGDVSKSIVDEILASKSTLINLVDIKTMDSYTYQHCVNVAVLSIILGVEFGFNTKQLVDLCTGALLHDIGKVFIPKEILTKPGKLTDEEYEIIKEHPTKGYQYLDGNRDISAHSKMIILQHHEKIDATGYPRQIDGFKIHTMAKIVAIADVYDAITSDRPYRKALSPSEAVEFIMAGAGRHFDFEMAQTFVRKVIPYPEGTLVKLSNGEVGVVEEVKPNFPLRPKVKVIKQKAVNIEMQSIDLINENNIIIEGIQYEAPNLSIPHYLKNR
ncbi:MAG: hypothetical protein PWQ70_1611 [Clostridiales bacterium]|nr:hypothetical protein [Clostridiales bacterium]